MDSYLPPRGFCLKERMSLRYIETETHSEAAGSYSPSTSILQNPTEPLRPTGPRMENVPRREARNSRFWHSLIRCLKASEAACRSVPGPNFGKGNHCSVDKMVEGRGCLSASVWLALFWGLAGGKSCDSGGEASPSLSSVVKSDGSKASEDASGKLNALPSSESLVLNLSRKLPKSIEYASFTPSATKYGCTDLLMFSFDMGLQTHDIQASVISNLSIVRSKKNSW